MMAAVSAAQSGHSVLLLEKNEKLGKKIYITGKGRCNFTNACGREEFFENVMSNPRFFYSAYSAFSSEDAMSFFEQNGMPVKVERGNRAFPVSDHASDVTKALADAMKRLNVTVRLHAEVSGILTTPYTEEGAKKSSYTARVTGVSMKHGETIPADVVIIATGGLSYPSTGSTGGGYRFAKEAGHTVTRLTPSLVSLNAKESFCAELSGLSLRNIGVQFVKNGKTLYEDFGELLFTHKGVSGPVVLSATGTCGDSLTGSTLYIDLKPALSEEKLDERLIRELRYAGTKQINNIAGTLVPASLVTPLLTVAGIRPETKAGDITKEMRQSLLRSLKAFPVTITGMGGYNEAVVTKGGINVKEVNPSTMESRLVKGLRFAGEVLDLDAMTGGFNLQIAWSTGYLAGQIKEEKQKKESGKKMTVNIAIDGPAGAGKSTIAKAVAKRMGYIYVDTGAMYRTIALYLLRKGISADDAEAISKAGREADVTIDYKDGVQQVLLFGENVSGLIRTEEVGNMASASSVNKDIRDKMADLQRKLAETKDVVMDGRDIGTNVLPNAQVKVYLTASIEERARRRVKEYEEKGIEADYEQIAKDIAERDYRDMHREHAPLCRAEDAVLLDTSDMTIPEVEDAMIRIIEEKLGK